MDERIQKRTLVEQVILPERDERVTSYTFKKTKVRLKKDGHFSCYVCRSTENLEVHHFGCEYSLSNSCDFDKLKNFCEEFDPYGYGKLLKNIPFTDVDDIRNMMVLCEEHHTGCTSQDGIANGIHNITFPAWIIQKLAKDGVEPIPD